MPSRIPQVTQSYTPRHRIGTATAMLMIGVTALVDLLQFLLDLIPIAGAALSGLISLIMVPVLIAWFKICGATFVRSPGGIALLAFGELFGSFLPLMVGRTAWSILQTWKDDKAYNAKMAQQMKNNRQEQMKQVRASNTFRSPRYAPAVIALLFFATYASVFTAPHAFAQVYGKPAPLSATIVPSPSVPGPFTTVTLTYSTFSMDKSRATISWYVNGELKARGVGVDTYKVKTGPSGSRIVIQAKGEPLTGEPLLATLELRPAYVTIVWEAQTYTPPFYKGKALPIPGADVKYVAMPLLVDEKGQRIDPSKLMYKWRQNNRPLPELSGIGKRSVVLTNDKYTRVPEVSVEVSTLDGSIKAGAAIKVFAVQPLVVFYIVHPLLGVEYENALGDRFNLAADEFTVLGEPYFYSVKQRTDAQLSYEWMLNSVRVSSDPVVTMRPQGTEGGTSRIDVLVRHLTKVMQSARGMFFVTFSAPKTGSGVQNQTSDTGVGF